MTIWNLCQLHGALERYDGDHPFKDVLEPILPNVLALMQPLQPLRRLSTSPPGRVDPDILQDFFALTVVDDLLITSAKFRSAEREAFFSALGFAPFDVRTSFSPLVCEIAAVSNDGNPAAGIELLGTHWPGLMFGDMVFSRCAKTVRCHPSQAIVARVADKTMLHFTNQRPNRPTNDLSHGWGHNSRWSTDFHRNYRAPGLAFYNVDAPLDIGTRQPALQRPGSPPAELGLAESRELLLHRGFVRTPKFADEWPYAWRLAMRDTGRAWPLNEADLLPFDDALRMAGIA